MRAKGIVTMMLTVGAAAVMFAAPRLGAQTPQEHQQHSKTDQAKPAQAKPGAGMEAKCQAMMAGHEKMMADMKAADQRLDGLVGAMNAKSGTAKTEATAAVVSEMITQDRAMRAGMMKMEHDTMGHMMEHMMAGKDSMAMCPMMKETGGMKH